tara:strand:+ start:31 stop:243 length:213 start_codon:yes stop_codon:yes gene_type:complete
MAKNKRKYYVSEQGTVRAAGKETFLVYWNDGEKNKLSRSTGPYSDFKEAEKIMIRHLISGVCSWIVSYNG